MSVSRGLRLAPHLVVGTVGYVLFAYAAVPDALMETLDVGFTAFGLLMSAALGAFVVAQAPTSRLLDRRSATRLLLWGTVVHAILAVALDLVATFEALLALRFLWGLTGGFVLSVGATQISRLATGGTATREQGIYGGMLTLGGALGFLSAPTLVSLPLGLNAFGAVLALPGLALVWRHRDTDATAPATTSTATASVRSVLTHPVVAVASLCYVAIISSYVTLSTFITAYYADLGVVAPLNAVVLVMATVGRTVGGTAVWTWPVSDEGLVAGSTAVAALGFGALAVGSGTTLVLVLPLLAMVAVSLPFGATYALAAAATDREGTAIATMVAAGNVAALVVPAVTGALRDVTGSYTGGFLLLAALNLLALCGVGLLVVPRGLPSEISV
ncbi:Major Facilitator Superfamily protein [Halogranum amylolyticum]|uniref:Major Facilitator Superfamily protein n=1 Tax=Halogranum amylolyticum TaxID=660520 RepID=A0A1H8N544_9EURY|nr:MFS transporter [Halogranum amylolyticum]SEO24588.1 Major Facilitator Superfamily protein [Halogranum amylolyticum]